MKTNRTTGIGVHVLLVAASLACGGEGTPAQRERAEPQTIESDNAAESEASSDSDSEGIVRYDLIRHAARAQLHEGSALVMDFGGARTAHYTLGGWRTRTGATHTFGEDDALLINGVTGEILLPSEQASAATLSVRLRGFGARRATLYVNGDTVHHVRLPRDGAFTTVHATLPTGVLLAGENMFQVRVPEVGRQDGVRAGVAIDWMRLTPGAPGEGTPSETIRAPAEADGTLVIPAGLRLSWPFDVWAGSQLHIGGRGTGRVLIQEEGEEPRELAALDGQPVRVSLPEAFISLTIEATTELALERAQVRLPGTPRARPSRAAPKNVIVFLVDTVRADKLRPFNPESRVRTPGLDSWARRTALFSAGHTQENWTKPSVATLLTGLYPWEHTASSGEAVLPSSVAMLSEQLRDEGFLTGAFICNGYVSDKFGFRQGWSSFRNYIREGRRTQARFVAADVLEWLDGRDEDKPFFLYIHTIDPHVPYMPPDSILAEYDSEPYDGPINFNRDRELLEKIKSGRLRPTARDRVRLEALYDGEITYHDVHFASIMEGLERRGLDDDTMIVFTADHGAEFFDHDPVVHGHSLFEELLHVPLLIRLPGQTDQAVRVDEAVGLVDVVPTVFDALGLNTPQELAGRSLLPLMAGQLPDAPLPVVSGFMEGWRSVVVGRYKLIQRTHRRMMVYDLQADPRERNDLSATRPMLVRYLRGLLGLTLAGHAEPRHTAGDTTIDPETEAQLRALGYVGTQRPQ